MVRKDTIIVGISLIKQTTKVLETDNSIIYTSFYSLSVQNKIFGYIPYSFAGISCRLINCSVPLRRARSIPKKPHGKYRGSKDNGRFVALDLRQNFRERITEDNLDEALAIKSKYLAIYNNYCI